MVRFGAAVFACVVLAATARAEPGPGPRVWPDRIADVSAAEFWKQVEEGGLLPKRKYESFFRALPADAGGDAKGRDAAIPVLDAALALGDLRDGKPARVHEQSDCYCCHSNGPRGLHPGRIDLGGKGDILLFQLLG